ncbi:MAG: precorrin-4 C(11)-methyltransferase [Rhodospirillaceae bacterium]|nr:precorrin-4 C(11)-methyltransferase [Rhodospirillaceae bacterium]|tara:strand:+ start:325 stop:1086 length:762 start_codon:yes stop_codon:yes gene_type:complete
MTVHFIGAGPGDPDLITVRGRKLIEKCNICLFAGSLIPKELVGFSPPDAKVIDTSPLNLDEIIQIMIDANEQQQDIARLHSGDPSLYGAIAEQIRRLKALNINFDITPGVPTYAAAAAVLEQELTVPEISQTVILTRTTMKSSPMPPEEELENLAACKATLAIHLSIRNLRFVRRKLEPAYGRKCPVMIIYRATWPDQKIIRTTLENMFLDVRSEKITRTALILVGRIFEDINFSDSALYSPAHDHLFRNKKS